MDDFRRSDCVGAAATTSSSSSGWPGATSVGLNRIPGLKKKKGWNLGSLSQQFFFLCDVAKVAIFHRKI
jgi:hypothetical protein